jgi:hypothetical protein
MPLAPAFWRNDARRRSRRGRGAVARRLVLEWLEDRTLPSGSTLTTACLLSFNASHTAQAVAFLADPRQADLYRVRLGSGDVLTAAVSAQVSGGGLSSLLRVFDASGAPVAADRQEGGDPRLTFQAATAGDYFLGVSSAPNDDYDPRSLDSGSPGGTTGLYTLTLRDTAGAALRADLAGASFRLGTDTAAWGEAVPVAFTVENRGAAPAGAFEVQVLASAGNRFAPASSVVVGTFALTGLGAGQAFSSGGFTVTLPDPAAAAAADLPVSGPVYLGLRIDPTGALPEVNPFDQGGVHRGADWEALTVVTPVVATGGNHSPAGADALGDRDSRVSGMLAAGQQDWYRLTTSAAERLTAWVTAPGGSTPVPRLTLAGPDGQLLIQSDGGSIAQLLRPGTYYLAVSAGSGAGGYQLTAERAAARPLFDLLPSHPYAAAAVAADLTGDGIPDLTIPDGHANALYVLLGNGDGTFQPARAVAAGPAPEAVAVADLNGDGIPDLVAANHGGDTLSVLLGNGDGTFRAPRDFGVGSQPKSVAVADVNGDGMPDLVTANHGDDTASVLLGNGDGTFQPQQTQALGAYLDAVAVADVNGDGTPDLVTANYGDDTASVLLGNGDGTFQGPLSFPVGPQSDLAAVADLTGDGIPDLVVAHVTPGSPGGMSVLLGNGDGTFGPPQTFAVVGGPDTVEVADVNGDGIPDLVVTYSDSGAVGVFLGNGDGTFRQPQPPYPAAEGLHAVTVADVSGDGKPDLVVLAYRNVSVLLGNGDGTFQGQQRFGVGSTPFAVAVADVNGDGKPEIVVANKYGNTVGVLLSHGDGTFRGQRTFPVGNGPASVAVADVNGDGKPDLVAANEYDNTVGVLLGNGDGTFQPQQTQPVGAYPDAVAVADVNGDGIPDLVVANHGPLGEPGDTVGVLLGDGDGTFRPQQTYTVGSYPGSVAVADLNGDGIPDLVVANSDPFGPGTVSVLRGNGDGTFRGQHTLAVGDDPDSVAVADVNGDGKPDLVVANRYGHTVSVLLGNGDGTFRPQQTYEVGEDSDSVAVADVNGDGKPDLVVANSADNTVSVLLGNGDGTFQDQQTFRVGVFPTAVAATDINSDGKPDLVVAHEVSSFGGGVNVLLGKGDGSFVPASPEVGMGLRNTPYLADLTGEGAADSVILDRSGNILFRQVRPGAGSPFGPPVILNPGRPARDLTVLRTAARRAVATADAGADPDLSPVGHFVYTVSLYAYGAGGQFRRTTAFSTPLLPTRLAAADLTGDGLDDLVVTDSLDNSIQVAFQQPGGTFSPPLTLVTAGAPSDVSLADVNGDGLPDIAVSNQASGDVSVFLNDVSHSFATRSRFRAGPGLFGLDSASPTPAITSLMQPVSLAAGDFTGGGRNDLVVVNRGSHSLSVLANDDTGGFANPRPALTTSTSDGPAVNARPGPVVAGSFHGPGRPLDLAVLMEDSAQVWIYTGHGDGTFTHSASLPAGTSPTGLSAVPGSAPGLLDLLVGNEFGDVLRLVGDGRGHFQPPPPLSGDHTALDVRPLKPGGSPAVLVANQKGNRVTVQAPSGAARFAPVRTLADDPASHLAPGAVQWARLEGPSSPFFDAVVVASGANAVLVYRGTGFDAAGNPTFAPPVSYAVGTDPVSVAIQDVSGDGIPDLLVANQGSNDLSELFGARDAQGQWVARPGPRLKSGGRGPIAVAVRPANGPGLPALVVTNGQSGNLAVLPGVGQGFFNDQFKDPNTQLLNVPGNPALRAASFFGTSGVALTADGRVVGFNLADFAATVATVFAPPAGQAVTAAQPLEDGGLVVAEEGGTVVLLEPVPGSSAFQSVQVLTPLTGIPSNPSALAVLEDADGLRALVTNAGLDQLFVYGSAPPEPLPVVLAGPSGVLLPPAAGGPVAEATALGEAPLGLVVTLTAGLLPAGPSGAANPAAVAEATPAVALVTPHDSDEADDEETAEPPAGSSMPPSDFELGIDEVLRGLDLYRKPDGGGPDGASSRRLPREGPGTDGLALAAFWQAVGEGALPEPCLGGAPSLAAARRAATETVSPSGAAVAPAQLGPAGGNLAEAAPPPSRADNTAGALLRPAATRDRAPALAVVLAVGGLALWVGRESRARSGPQ